MPEPHLRAGDTDREAVAAVLGTHMAAGRLTLAEYDERVAQAYAATTFGELARLTADLPAPAATAPGPAPAAPQPAPATRSPAVPVPAPPPLPLWGRHGLDQHSWRAWLTTSVTVLVVYLLVSFTSGEFGYFWPVWVIGPWGAALLATHLGGGRPRTRDGRREPGR